MTSTGPSSPWADFSGYQQKLAGHRPPSENRLKYNHTSACKDGLVYVPKHSHRTCSQSRYERPYMHHNVIF